MLKNTPTYPIPSYNSDDIAKKKKKTNLLQKFESKWISFWGLEKECEGGGGEREGECVCFRVWLGAHGKERGREKKYSRTEKA